MSRQKLIHQLNPAELDRYLNPKHPHDRLPLDVGEFRHIPSSRQRHHTPGDAPKYTLPKRWAAMRKIDIQQRYVRSTARFNVVPAGRRSGKTEIAKRRGIRVALEWRGDTEHNVVFAAPTYRQAKRIYWNDLKKMIAPRWRACKPSETELMITLRNGSCIHVMGMDRPERIEGIPLHHIVLDESANMREESWSSNVRPALSDTHGTADLIGVPEGRNHFYDWYNDAEADDGGEWMALTWHSSIVLPPEEIVAARRDLDPLTFAQEYEASFVTFGGLIYYQFDRKTHVTENRLEPDHDLDLHLCFDFNTSPGTATVLQENPRTGTTDVIDEVYVRQNSKTPKICKAIIERYGDHRSTVKCFGDATGGAGGSAKTEGSDWELVKANLRPVFKDRLRFKVPKSNPSERARVNSMNTRLMTTAGDVRLRVSKHCKWTIKDFEGVKDDGTGDIDKKADRWLTHLTDGIGYCVEQLHPINKRTIHWQAI